MIAGNNRLAVLAAEIIRADLLFRRASHEAAQAALDAGNALIEAKALVKHGEWLPWLKANVPMSERTAQRYMRLAETGMKSDTLADLGIAGALGAIARKAPAAAPPVNWEDLKAIQAQQVWLRKKLALASSTMETDPFTALQLAKEVLAENGRLIELADEHQRRLVTAFFKSLGEEITPEAAAELTSNPRSAGVMEDLHGKAGRRYDELVAAEAEAGRRVAELKMVEAAEGGAL